ncbi:molybdenum cofactor biosynthesis protein MoaE, partial [Vibrio parahaemolyticus]|nr:molybdenum cofactor biosynthesis protein MoaE [Vibrio parahaemolyticus]
GLTEKSGSDLCDEAEARWPRLGVRGIQRVGDMDSGDQIVFVGGSSAHRGAACDACGVRVVSGAGGAGGGGWGGGGGG